MINDCIYDRASETDDAAIRKLLSIPMQGEISLSMKREPAYFKSVCVEGHYNDTFIGRCTQSRDVVAVASCSEKAAYINGNIDQIAYFSALRFAESHRSMRNLTKAYRYVLEERKSRNIAYNLTSIVSDNHHAKRVLSSNISNLPRYTHFGKYGIKALLSFNSCKSVPGLSIHQATEFDLPRIIKFLQSEGKRKQFFPHYELSDFNSGGLLQGLKAGDCFIAEKENQIQGLMGLWNQSPFKQNIVASYSLKMKLLRPIYNAFSATRKHPKLPAINQAFVYRIVAFPLIKDDQLEVFNLLINNLLEYNKRNGQAMVLIGTHELDPFYKSIMSKTGRTLLSDLYFVEDRTMESKIDNLDNRIPYFELGAL